MVFAIVQPGGVDGLALALAEAEGLILWLGEMEALGESDADGESERLALDEGDTDAEAEALGLSEALGDKLADGDCDPLGD